MQRSYSLTDQFCVSIDQALRALSNHSKTTGRPYPAGQEKKVVLSKAACKHSAGLMRINHAGEICAQALYHGQALAARDTATGEQLQQAAIEEGDHLAWCSQRLEELGSHTSYLNPVWYLGSFLIGLTAGLAGDRWSLGFVAETEKQVVQHLQTHLQQLPEQDAASWQILQQMQQDEEMHRQAAVRLGAAALPPLLQTGMQWLSRCMVKTAYWL